MADRRFVCAQCGSIGSPDEGYTLIDSRYAIGLCTGDHVGPQYLVREGQDFTPKSPRPSPEQKGEQGRKQAHK